MMEKENPGFCVNSCDKIDYFEGKDVLFLTTTNGNTAIHLPKGRVVIKTDSMKHCVEILGEFVVGLDEKTAVNLANVMSFAKGSRTITFNSGDEFILSAKEMKNYKVASFQKFIKL